MWKSLMKVLAVFFLTSILMSHSVYAERNVKDCLEDDDCIELESEELDDETVVESDDNISSNQTGSMIINILKIVFALALVLILIYILLLFLKKKNKLSMHNQALETLGGISVGQQKSIQVVRIGEKVYAIGVGNDVTMLDEITDKKMIQQLEESATEEPQAITFIQNWLLKKSKNTKSRNKHEKNHSFSKTLEKELDDLKANREQLMEMNKKDDDING